MKIRVLKPFTTPTGAYDVGEVKDVPDRHGTEWCRIGYAAPATDTTETAEAPATERAVTREPRRRR